MKAISTKAIRLIKLRNLFFMNEQTQKALRNALASAQMEGFEVTKQTEKDCIRLLSNEISIPDLVQEILSRPEK